MTLKSLHAILCLLLILPVQAQTTDTGQLVTNLSAFAKLYGYVRYFHPADEAASVNWDKFAVYGCEKISRAKNQSELLNTLQQIFAPVAPSVRIYDKKSLRREEPLLIPPHPEKYKIVAWQHYGMGSYDPQSVYKSVRVNRPPQDAPPVPGFAPISQYFDGKPYAGKQLLVRAWMKVIAPEQNGTGHLWLRVEKSTGIGFFYNMDERPASDSTWKRYEFIAGIDKDAERIIFGAFLNGSGRLLIDNYEIFIKENDSLQRVTVDNGSFEEATRNSPAAWVGETPSYDYSITTKDVKGGAHALSIAFQPETPTPTTRQSAQAIFDGLPTAPERIRKALSAQIEASIPISLYALGNATFPSADRQQLSRLQNEMALAAKTNRSANALFLRVADIVIAWNIFRHFFPYWPHASRDPETLLKESLARAIRDKTADDFLTTLRLMTASLNDGHIFVFMEGDTSNRLTIPVIADWTENKVVINRVLDTALQKQLYPGDVVAFIDNIPADKFVSNQERTISGSPQWKKFNAMMRLFAGGRNTTVELSIIRKGKVKKLKLKRTMPIAALYGKVRNRPASGPLRNRIYYLDLDKIPYEDIQKRLPELKKSKAIICDLRGYPKSNHQLITHLLKKPENDKWMFIPRITRPDYENVVYDSLGWNMKPQGDPLTAKIIFITDGSAISYAESFMGFIKDLRLGTIVGQPTAGTNGNVNRFRLPGGYSLSFTGMMVRNHDGSQHHILGTIPDIIVEKTIAGIAAGEDEFLEKALELAEKD